MSAVPERRGGELLHFLHRFPPFAAFRPLMRRPPLPLFSVVAAALAALLALPAAAQAPPPKLEPVPEPPPQIGVEPPPASEPGVTITPGTGGEKVEEFSIDGRKYIRVIQPNGLEYYLVEELPGGAFAGTQSSDSRIRVPQWVILQF